MNTNNWPTARKMAADASNAIAKQAVMKFPDFLKEKDIITEEQYMRLKEGLENKSQYSSGYDVYLGEAVKGAAGIVAEVKSNYPCEGNSFGSQQKTKIKEDLDHLTGAEPAKNSLDISGCYKFFVMLDDGNGEVRKAIERLVKSYNKALKAKGITSEVVIWDTRPLNTTDVFVVLL